MKLGALYHPHLLALSRNGRACSVSSAPWGEVSGHQAVHSSQGPASPAGWFPAKFVEVLDERSKEVRGHVGPAVPGS